MIEAIAASITLGAIVFYKTQNFLLLSIVSLAIVIVGFFYFKTKRGVVMSALIALSILLGAVCIWNALPPDVVLGKQSLHGTVTDVDTRLEKTNINIQTDSGETIQLQIRGSTGLLPGDTLTATGELKIPEDFVTNTGRVFDYDGYLLARGVVGIMQDSKIFDIQIAHGFNITRIATKLRLGIAATFSQYVSFPFDGALSGMVVGYQGGLTSEMQYLFKNTGTLHALVLSGYNVALLATILAVLLLPLPFKLRIILSGIAIVGLVLISGAGISAIRAGIMGSIGLFGLFSARTYNAWRALIIAYLVLFFMSPFAVFADPGFQLSFLASFFMICILPSILLKLSFIPEKKIYLPLREMAALGFILPIFMLPYTMYFSGLVPLSSPFANIVVAIAVPIITILGLILLCVSWIAPFATILGTLLSFLGNILLVILTFLLKIPVLMVPEFSGLFVLSIYVVFCMYFFKKDIRLFWLQIQNIAQRQPN
jgi:ComEC/Rec2-related protein